MADTAILDGGAKQVKVPTLVAGGAKSPGSLKAAVERGPRGDPRLPAPLARGADPQLGGRSGRGVAKEFFLGR